MEKKYRLTLTAPVASYEGIMLVLPIVSPYGWEERDLPDNACQFMVYGNEPAYLDDIRNRVNAAVPEITAAMELVDIPDPMNAWKEYFTPVKCGTRFIVLPPWLKEGDYGGRQKILIEPKSAFGTGHHATTALVLTVLADLLDAGSLRKGDRFLDLGCGSGILGIAAALSGLEGEALDIDPVALENTIQNVELNGARGIAPIQGGMDSRANNRYHLILANILAQPLIEMAPIIRRAVEPGGILILSGILRDQAATVDQAYEACGMSKTGQRHDGDWVALTYELPGSASK